MDCEPSKLNHGFKAISVYGGEKDERGWQPPCLFPPSIVCDHPPKYLIVPDSRAESFRGIMLELESCLYAEDNPFFKRSKGVYVRERQPINNTKEDSRGKRCRDCNGDTGRYMTDVQLEDKFKHHDSWHENLCLALQPLMPLHKIQNMQLLESDTEVLPPGEFLKVQQCHTDYVPKDPIDICPVCHLKRSDVEEDDSLERYANNSEMSYSCIIALTDNVSVHFYYPNPWKTSKDDPEYIRRDIIKLAKYQAVIWEANTIHAGGAYSTYGARLFLKFEGTRYPVDHKNFSWKPKFEQEH